MSFDLWLRRLRLVSGLVLTVFVAGHLLNLAVGLSSLEALDAWRRVFMKPWYHPLGEALLVASILVHGGLGLATLARRRSLAMSRIDLLQLVLGVATPPLVILHVLTMRVTGEVVRGFDVSYATILSLYWAVAPMLAFQQLLAVVVVWVHAALGLYAVLVLKPAWPRLRGLVLPALFLVPILAMLGFAEAGKTVLARLATDPEWQAHLSVNVARLGEARPTLLALQGDILTVYSVAVAAALLLWAARALRNRTRRVTIVYDGGLVASGRAGLTLLEISRLSDVPHAHVCSGRGRCGTCRVAVRAGTERLSAPTEAETQTLLAVGAPPGVRLACQAQLLSGTATVERLLPAYADASAARAPEDWVPALLAAGSYPAATADRLPDAAP